MQKNNRLLMFSVVVLVICAALPQLLLYYKGFYFVTDAPALLKYPLNTICFLGVAVSGYWYLKHAAAAFLKLLWAIAYLLGGLFIGCEYLYHFIYPGWNAQTYFNTMSVFEALVNPLPFLIAWLLVRVTRYLNKAGEDLRTK